jgi:hypothetical protein
MVVEIVIMVVGDGASLDGAPISEKEEPMIPVLISTPGPPTRAGAVTTEGGAEVVDGAATAEEETTGELPEPPGVLGPPSHAAAK